MQPITRSNRIKWVVLFFFLGYFVIGFSIVKDYGVHWDEFYSHDFGIRWYNYVYNLILKDAPLAAIENESQHDIIHGPVIEMLIAFLSDKCFGFKDTKDIIFFRHYVTWLIFFISILFFYFLCKSYFKSQEMALLGCLFLILHPRIFSHSFYDSVDIPFLSFYIISLYSLTRYIRTKTMGAACLHAFICAILIDIRSMGCIIPFLSLVIFSWHIVQTKSAKVERKGHIINMVIYIVLLVCFIILFWPYLWRNPLLCFIEVIKQTPRIFWGGTVLYFGEYISASDLPWHYIPVWIMITTPVFYSFCFFIGLFAILNKFIFIQTGDFQNTFVFLFAFFLPIGLVIGLHSILYDSWRHMYFVYPMFIIISLTGITSIYKAIYNYFQDPYRKTLNIIFVAIITVSLISTGLFMIKNHPHQNVYFNFLAGRNMKDIKNNFELDYWGLSYRKALEYIVKTDPAPMIPIFDELFWGPLANNLAILPVSDRNRIRSAKSPDDGKYVITNYRWHKEDYPYPNDFFSIKVGNAKIICVYKLKNE